MAINKKEFYEGAALRALICDGAVRTVRYATPYFIFNEVTPVYIKYSTAGRSPWGFTFTALEHERMHVCPDTVIIALVCGSDGVAAIDVEEYRTVAASRRSPALRVACHRRHGEHYEVSGPDGSLGRKVSPSRWKRILD